MKNLKLLLLLIIPFSIISCKKTDKTVFTPSASLLIANMVPNGARLTLNSEIATIGNNASILYPLSVGQNKIDLYDAASVPSVTYYNQSISAVNVGNYSLFLAGTSPTQVDAIQITETYKNYADSVCGIRFINLSPDNAPISVNLQGNANGSEANSLAYKAHNDFKQYPAKKSIASYTFEFRDAVTGDLITTYQLSTPYFHNVTLAFNGLTGNTGVSAVMHP